MSTRREHENVGVKNYDNTVESFSLFSDIFFFKTFTRSNDYSVG